MEMQNNREKGANIQLNPTHLKDNQIHGEISNTNVNSKDDKVEIINNNEGTIKKKSTIKENQMLKETKKIIKNKNENKVKGKIKNKIMKGNNDLRKSSYLDIYQERDFQTSSMILDPKILGGGNYRTSPENYNSKILEVGNYQISPKNINPRITEERSKRFQTSLVNSTPINCEEGSNQISLRNTTLSYIKSQKEGSLFKSSKKFKTLKD